MINSEYVVTKKKSVAVCIGANAMEKKKNQKKYEVWYKIKRFTITVFQKRMGDHRWKRQLSPVTLLLSHEVVMKKHYSSRKNEGKVQLNSEMEQEKKKWIVNIPVLKWKILQATNVLHCCRMSQTSHWSRQEGRKYKTGGKWDDSMFWALLIIHVLKRNTSSHVMLWADFLKYSWRNILYS